MADILVIDDEVGVRELISDALSDEGHTIRLAENAAQARQTCANGHPDLILLDIWMPDVDGITLLKEWGAAGMLTMPVIMMSGHATIDTAISATRIGAAGYLEKPFSLNRLLSVVRKELSDKGSLAKRVPESVHLTPNTPIVLPLRPELLAKLNFNLPFREAKDLFEKVYIEYHLEREKNNVQRISKKTGLDRTHLYRKMQLLDINLERKLLKDKEK